MITAYHRPRTMNEALKLLRNPGVVPLGGGTILSQPQEEQIEVVDLQSLALNSVLRKGNDVLLGATSTLQQLIEFDAIPQAMRTALRLEAPINLRNSGTVGGTLATCDGRSPFATCLLALDATVQIISFQPKGIDPSRSRTGYGGKDEIKIGDYLILRPHGLITGLSFPSSKFSFECVSRTPSDKPLICAALSRWNSGRTRLALGGFGKIPVLAMDGTDSDEIVLAARNACREAMDEWASAEYRVQTAAILANRCLNALQ
jgi:CO/xanthine dehydrogenase FAD-binding subunit